MEINTIEVVSRIHYSRPVPCSRVTTVLFVFVTIRDLHFLGIP
jgi:hypothetical protein